MKVFIGDNTVQLAGNVYTQLAYWLPRTGWMRKFPVLRWLHWRARVVWNSGALPVRVSLHGYDVIVNPGNSYPFLMRDPPLFNAPLVQLVSQVGRLTKGSVTFVDVGAATGDTVLLLKERCAHTALKFICVEAEAEFLSLLRQNMQQFNDVTIVEAMLGSEPARVRSLVKHHPGTAAALGDSWVNCVTLDSLPEIQKSNIDILKIDVDGFDGEVLAGSIKTLGRDHPAVIFEWHPNLIRNTGCEPFRAFGTLENCGYASFLWFNNIGTFSHFSCAGDHACIDKMREYLLRVNNRRDEHFDVIALHETSGLDQMELASLDYALKNSAK